MYDKSVKFLVTHNYDVKLPEIMFDGARFRIQPRAVEGNGIIAKLEYVPKSEIAEARSTDVDGRLFFKKKISKNLMRFLKRPFSSVNFHPHLTPSLFHFVSRREILQK